MTAWSALLNSVGDMDVCIRIWSLVFVILTTLVPHDYHVKFNLYIGRGICIQVNAH